MADLLAAQRVVEGVDVEVARQPVDREDPGSGEDLDVAPATDRLAVGLAESGEPGAGDRLTELDRPNEERDAVAAAEQQRDRRVARGQPRPRPGIGKPEAG
jgi:hypothetical protein